MKKSLLSATLLGLASAVVAQPTIQANQFNYLSAPAFTYKYQTGQTAVAPGAAGANVTWNFTSLAQGSNLAYTTAACPGDPDCGTFPGANQVLAVGTLAKLYYEKTNAGLEQIGEKASGTFVYSNPMKYMQFPMTFNQTYNDTYASSNGSDTKNGTVTSTIDGYGTLQTPTGTYTNVLRQKIVENATVTTGGQSANMVFTHYYWIKADMHHYIMSIVSTEISNAPVPVPATYAVAYTTSTAGGVGIEQPEILAGETELFPNPANRELHIQTRTLPLQQIAIFNLMGQQVLHHSVSEKQQFSITLNNLGLAPGSYFVQVNAGGSRVTKTLTIL
jgi:hypothetical protein